MAFTSKDWKDYPDTATPLSAAALEDLEKRVTDYAESENAHLKLATAADRKIKWGSSATSGFGGSNRLSHTIAHGCPSTPAVTFAWATYISSTSTSTSQSEPVICSVESVDGTNINVRLAIANAATASVGTTVYWVAIY